MTVMRLGNPPVPVKITETGTYLAKLEHVWQAARRYAKQHGYKVVDTYGVVGVAPFHNKTVGAWLGYLGIPCREPIHFHELFDNKFSWAAEWTGG